MDAPGVQVRIDPGMADDQADAMIEARNEDIEHKVEEIIREKLLCVGPHPRAPCAACARAQRAQIAQTAREDARGVQCQRDTDSGSNLRVCARRVETLKA